jgi:hydrogenase expression/formation protein HypC
MKVLEIDESTALVELGGTQRQVRLDIVDRIPQIGDYVIVHAGFAIRLIEEKEAQETLKYFEEMLSNDPETSQ